ncbi:hypothetical protein Cgig2_013611 [Carnegiea gigantea]|uniref:Uncharacterized protein n=1 Tax=Carnegiea gigantea TaxID=171969 RepID=A0A9Q1KBZ8_9CARY|nr:hypothetical protein Cgig2_013611 [Carnegiea gigantea]
MEDVRGLGEYAWAEAVWRILVETVKEMQQKLEGPVLDIQMNGFSLLVQFYEYTTRFAKHDNGRFPWLTSWDSMDHGRRYDALELVAGIKEFKVEQIFQLLTCVRAPEQAPEELCAEKEKHIDTERKLQFWMTHAKELEARLNTSKAHVHHPDAGLQPRSGAVSCRVERGRNVPNNRAHSRG